MTAYGQTIYKIETKLELFGQNRRAGPDSDNQW